MTLGDELKTEFTSAIDDTSIKPIMEDFYDRLAAIFRKYTSNVKITASDSAPGSPDDGEIWINTNP